MLRILLVALLVLSGAQADDFSGPLRVTLATESWGTLFFAPADLKDYDYRPDPGGGLRVMTGKPGRVTIEDAGIGSYTVTYPNQARLQAEAIPGGVRVTFYGQRYEFVRSRTAGLDELLVTLPDDRIRYTMGEHSITIEGRKGRTRITENEGDYRVVSTAGSYSYKPTPEGGFQVRGAPLVRFPYLYRGALFKSHGVGIFVDFKKLDPGDVLFRFSEWQPMLVFQR